MPATVERRSTLLALAYGLTLSAISAFGAPPDPRASGPEPSSPSSQIVADVQLGEGGVLRGILVDTEGMPVSNARVTIPLPEQDPFETVSDTAGRFSIGKLRGGTYQLAVGHDIAFVRAWAPDTAPPGSQPMALIVVGNQVVRGQFLHVHLGRRLVTGAVIAGAVAAPIIYEENRKSAPLQ